MTDGQVHHEPLTELADSPAVPGMRLSALLVAAGVALAVLTGYVGSPLWQAVRVLVVLLVTAAAAWYVRRAGRGGRGTVALVFGIVATVTGAGIGSAYLPKSGPPAVTALALIALVAGGILLAWGVIALTSLVPRWWRLLAVPAVLALFVFVLFPLTVAVNATNRPATRLSSKTPASYGLAYRDVAMRTSDGVRLSGWYIPARNGAAVLLVPGSGATRISLLSRAAVLAHHGYGALLLDTRGHGRSGGHAMDFGWYGDRDIGAAVSFLARQPGVRAGKIAVLGLSMGGEQAIVAAGSDRRIRAVVAEGVTGEQLADHGWLPQGIDGIVQRGLEWVEYTGAGLMSGAPAPMSMRGAIAAATGRPVLIIADGGVPDEPVAARWFQAASPAAVQVWVVPGAAHTAALAMQPQAWEARVTGFLDSALNPTAVPAA
jgi:uncharacterized protein